MTSVEELGLETRNPVPSQRSIHACNRDLEAPVTLRECNRLSWLCGAAAEKHRLAQVQGEALLGKMAAKKQTHGHLSYPRVRMRQLGDKYSLWWVTDPQWGRTLFGSSLLISVMLTFKTRGPGCGYTGGMEATGVPGRHPTWSFLARVRDPRNKAAYK